MIKFITASLVIILRLYQYSYAHWIHCIYKTLQNIRVLQERVYSKGIRHKIKIRNAHVKHKYKIVVVKLLSSVRPFVTPWTAAHQASLSFTNSRSLGKLMSIELMMPSNRLILCHQNSSRKKKYIYIHRVNIYIYILGINCKIKTINGKLFKQRTYIELIWG